MKNKKPTVSKVVESAKVVNEISDRLADSKKTRDELIHYAENPIIGIDTDNLHAFIKNHRWNINPSGHTKTIRDQLKILLKEFLSIINKQKTQIDVLDIDNKIDDIMKQILTLGLINFDYDKEADDPGVGPINLKFLGQELAHFLVVQGGKEGSTHSKMLQKLAQLSQFND